MMEDPTTRRVRLTRIGPFEVSTVFLGLDHRFLGKGPPILFETMTFLVGGGDGGSEYEDMNKRDGRWTTWMEAEAGHERAVKWLRAEYCAADDQPEEKR